MRCTWKITLALFFAVCSSLMAQRFTIDASSIKVDRRFVKAPIFQAQQTYKSLSRPAHDVRWLQFLVTYTPESGSKTTVWEDDLTVEMTVLLPAKKGQGYGNTILLTGTQVYFSVPGDGKKHYVLFFVPPAVLTKYCSFTKYENSDISSNVYAAVVFRKGRSNQVIARAYADMKGKSEADISKIFSKYYKSKIGVMRLENGLLPKDKTPWQWIDTDLFDFPKSMMEGKH